MKIKDLLKYEDFTIAEFWAVVDALPEEMNGKKHKRNIKAFFKKNGDPKLKAVSIANSDSSLTDQDYQDWHDTQGFIRRTVRHMIHMNRHKRRREIQRQHNKDVKDGKTERMRVDRDGNLVALGKKGRSR